ncbi:aldehyde dehydrogenase family protein [Arthrobacter sp. YD2]|uniref:aldehyde dehydrogenase family protein n=1 Tax=Arthrobacter sp. YD2 TaxID=3058046 RepID=UPI0025B57D99|nr:aldehyde dehydrogenase family protein [Arthrobacter sp. YD2]MDN3905561.1 aldehyde dehydrogenase family protein [Arthrobacter sp. YD2]
MDMLQVEEWAVPRGGIWTDGDGEPLPVREAATGEVIITLATASVAQAEEAARTAARAQRDWAALPPSARAAVLRRASELFAQHSDRITPWIVRESGGTWAKAGTEILAAVSECAEASALPTLPQGDTLATNKQRWSFSRRVPAGVVSVIAPFNYPLTLAIRSVAPALAVGNAVLLKPDPRTTVCGGAVIQRIFDEAGLPAGVLQVLPGGAEIGAAVVSAPEVRIISFTGSTAAGIKVGEAAARQMKRAHLELGGNNAVLVLPGADTAAAAAAGAFASFLHQGQICQAAGRHLVHVSQVEDYLAELARIAKSLMVGDPWRQEGVQIGPVIDERQLAAVEALVDGAVAAGARVHAGGRTDGRAYLPTVLSGVEPGMPVWRDEIFGPVAPVLAYETLDEAVELVNASPYGLSVAVLGDAGTAMSVADRIHSGVVHINEQTVGDEATAPFGGMGTSGNGARFGGPEANFEAFTETQWVTVRPTIETYAVPSGRAPLNG